MNMYKTNPDELQNAKCYSCKFCVWDEDRKAEVCDVKGCYKNSKFIYYGETLDERILGN